MSNFSEMSTEQLIEIGQTARKETDLATGNMVAAELRRRYRAGMRVRCKRCQHECGWSEAAYTRLHGRVCPRCFFDVEDVPPADVPKGVPLP